MNEQDKAAQAEPVAWVDSVMEQAQVFASAWSLVGGRFDDGSALEHAEQMKAELRAMLSANPAPAVAQEPVGYVNEMGQPFLFKTKKSWLDKDKEHEREVRTAKEYYGDSLLYTYPAPPAEVVRELMEALRLSSDALTGPNPVRRKEAIDSITKALTKAKEHGL